MRPIARLTHLLAPFRGSVALAVFLNFATVASSVGLMAVSGFLISKAALVKSSADLELALAGVRLFALSRAALRYGERYVSHATTFKVLTRLRVWFYQAIEPLAPARLMGYRSGDLLSRIVSDIDTLEMFYARVVVPPLAAVLVALFTALLLGYFDWRVAAVTLLLMALTGLAVPLATRRLGQEAGEAAVAARAGLQAQIADDVFGMADLLLYGGPEAPVRRVSELEARLQEPQRRLAHLRGLAAGFTALFTGLSAPLILLLAVRLVNAGRLDGVYLALLPLAAAAAFEVVGPLAQMFEHLGATGAAANRLFELIDAEPAVADPVSPAPRPAAFGIEARDLTFRYGPDEAAALNGLSFCLESGGRLAVSGPSGAGKTTLVNLLLRFWDVTPGQLWLGGRDIRDYAADDIRSWIAVVDQHTYLFNTTLRDNLLLAKSKATDEELLAACEAAQLGEFLRNRAGGLDAAVGENGLQLSGGERQRLAVARALLKDAPIVILDEATAHLDAVTAAELRLALDRLMDGRTVLVISHQNAGSAPSITL